ncbi:MAG: GntR family transcriptional regulator, partial [Victivallales bacterium]|nr:GntR family transcriptional regulator [Victivallales bacterium]
MMTKTAKHEKLYHSLKSILIELEPDHNFISVREIMRRFDVSQSTVSSAVEPLLEEGLLEKRNGLGMFVTPEVMKYKANTPPVIIFALPRWVSEENLRLENIFLDLQHELNITGEVLHYDWRDGTIRQLPSRKVDGMIVLPAAQSIKAEQIHTLDSLNVPYLLLGQNLKDLEVNTVYCDDEYGASLAADHLIKLKHKRMAILLTEPRNKSTEDRLRGFAQYCELQGVEAQIVDCQIQSGDCPITRAYQKVKDLTIQAPLT